jgi:hypothetical protein
LIAGGGGAAGAAAGACAIAMEHSATKPMSPKPATIADRDNRTDFILMLLGIKGFF